MLKNPKTFYSKREKILDDFINSKGNDVYTPEIAIKYLLPFLNKNLVIWDCAFGTGELSKHFKKYGFNIIGVKEQDFLKDDINKTAFDIIITNPPYQFKDEFLKRAFEINKPFCFLLPLTALEGIKRGEMLTDRHIQLIIPNRRINFIIPSGKKSAWFPTAWFCYGLNLPRDLIFMDLRGIKENGL